MTTVQPKGSNGIFKAGFLKKMGIWAFLFFLLKGLLWLALAWPAFTAIAR